jgi:hypothetical protein
LVAAACELGRRRSSRTVVRRSRRAFNAISVMLVCTPLARGLHSSTFHLNLRRFQHSTHPLNA